VTGATAELDHLDQDRADRRLKSRRRGRQMTDDEIEARFRKIESKLGSLNRIVTVFSLIFVFVVWNWIYRMMRAYGWW
jgi:ABC-type uncharacterized transport system involved in gliding motility auxiliary subunit